ncbi:MAG TPA: crosslink repair DNA glycosylase YcaQ family protein [Blastocatellia bacterium]|nr:crosslink repair DNA glycosylase YcaQ family protein [Blastocatellia bacterium]
MPKRLELSRDAARALMLAVQGLSTRPEGPVRPRDVLGAIRRMGVLQIDTIHVVARSPYLVLWSRLGDFDQQMLDRLLARRKIFEYWAHEACFIPMEDYPLFRRFMLEPVRGNNALWMKWIAQNEHVTRRVLEHVRAHGPVMAADFERTDGQKGGWWNWKPEKAALEHLLTTGELAIVARENFHRRYDITERGMPACPDDETPSMETVRRELALRTVRTLGVARPRWVPDYYRTPKPGNATLLAGLVEEGALVEVEISELGTALVHPDNLRLARRAAAGRLASEHTTVLSPFDPIVWDRARALELFDFDYRIECYTPAAKRRYGYFSLPILSRGALVGRLDAKAHRRDGVFEVRSLYVEPGVEVSDPWCDDVAGAVMRFARWHQTPRVVVGRVSPAAVKRPFVRALKRV